MFDSHFQEAIVVILDVNSTMLKNMSGSTQARIETAKESIKMLLEQKVSQIVLGG